MILRLVLSVLLSLPALAATAGCREDAVELRGDWGAARFRVELAESSAERARGLMYVREMPLAAGMLFVYPKPQPRIGFWMKNTFIPLDILFFDETGTLRRVHPQAEPHDETMIPGGPGIQYVLELNGGITEELGIAPGAELRHPDIDQDVAAWPC